MVKKLVFSDADFSENAIPVTPVDPRIKLDSSMVVQGLIAEAGGIRPDQSPYNLRVSKITLTNMDEYMYVTIPSGIQWCACFFKESGTPQGKGSATWMPNDTGSAQTYRIDSAANFLDNTFRYYTIAFGYITSGVKLSTTDLDNTIDIYLGPAE